jgi:Bacterial toxin homologue of phage lysozyme, C-term
MNISNKAIDFIIEQEIDSEASYNKQYIHPMYAGGDSGVTIGVGYDLGYNDKDTIANDWGKYLSTKDVALLQSVSGLKGLKAKEAITAEIKAITIPYSFAKKVFENVSVPKFWNLAKKIYPQIDELNADTQGALTSMVYNRGNSLDGSRRANMRNIVPLVAAKDYKGIAREIDASKELWRGKGLDGLITRREDEAQMIIDSLV